MRLRWSTLPRGRTATWHKAGQEQSDSSTALCRTPQTKLKGQARNSRGILQCFQALSLYGSSASRTAMAQFWSEKVNEVKKKWTKSMLMEWPEVTFLSPEKKQTKPKKTGRAVCRGAGTASGSESNAPQYGHYFKSALEYFESSKALFKRLGTHCSTVSR